MIDALHMDCVTRFKPTMVAVFIYLLCMSKILNELFCSRDKDPQKLRIAFFF